MINTKNLTLASAAVMAAFTLAACSGQSQPPTVTITETSSTTEQQPTPTATETATATSTTEDASIGGMAMEIAWDELDDVSQDAICSSYESEPDFTVDLFFEEVGDESYGIRRSEVISLFDREC